MKYIILIGVIVLCLAGLVLAEEQTKDSTYEELPNNITSAVIWDGSVIETSTNNIIKEYVVISEETSVSYTSLNDTEPLKKGGDAQ